MKTTGIIFIIAGIILGYLAFTVIRSVTWTLLTHMGGIAAILACVAAVYLYRSLRRD